MAKRFAFSAAQRDAYLNNIRAGMQRGAAADDLGLERRKVREYIAAHRDFEKAVLDAEVDATELVLEALHQAASSGNVQAAKAWLELKGQIPASGGAGVAPGGSPRQPSGGDADTFGELDNVTALEPRRRRR